MTAPQQQRFLIGWWLSLAALLLIAGLLNRQLDAYGLRATTTAPDALTRNPLIDTHVRLWKAWRLRRVPIDALILGSSRAENGLDPSHPGWQRLGLNTFNAGLPSANLRESVAYLRHAWALHPLKRVLLLVDPLLLDGNAADEPDFDRFRLARGDASDTVRGWLDGLRTDLSISALAGGIARWHSGPETATGPYLESGFRSRDNQRSRVVAEGGSRAATAAMVTPYLNEIRAAGFDADASSNWAPLRDLLADPPRAGALRIDVVFAPAHALECQMFAHSGRWEVLLALRQQVLAIAAELAALDSPITLRIFDFACANARTAVALPNDDAILADYWEFSHFRPELGDAVLDVVLADGAAPSPGFGEELTATSLPAQLCAMARRQRDYADAQAAQVQMLGLDGAAPVPESCHD